MDPVDAFKLVGTVLQFVDSANRFLVLAHKLHRPGSSADDDHSDLRKIADNFDAVLPTLQETSFGSKDEKTLRQLAQDCGKTATRLLAILRQVKPTEISGKRDALKVAFRLVFKQEEIKVLSDRLSSFRSQLNFHLLLSIREHVSKSTEQQAEGLKKLCVVENETAKIGGIAASILRYLASKQHLAFKQSGGQIQSMISLREDLVGTINEFREKGKGAHGFQPANIQLSPSDYRHALAWFLSRLRYDNMIDRENRIVTAHENTFQWAFEDNCSKNNESGAPKWSNLKEWLESNDQLYWITGKLGSGKSTLMKFLSCLTVKKGIGEEFPDEMEDNAAIRISRCDPYLRVWAGGQPLIIASFYFWNSGVNLQMTQAGLLRTLLSQIVTQRPDILPILAPKEWEVFCLFDHQPENWTAQEVQTMFSAAVKILRTNSKLCFFIDGLDEFDGNHQELIGLVKTLIVANENVKICVSSRPWNVFQKEFETKPSLRLEDFTFDDIKNFVQSKFNADVEFSNLQLRYSSFANELAENIVKKASGVFLWVDLVVTSLLDGMRLGDRIEDFQQRLDELPPELEKLYEKILYSLDKFYLKHATECFGLVEAAGGSLTILQFSFAHEGTLSVALNMKTAPLSHGNLSLRTQAVNRQLNSRCKGLLEVQRGLEASTTDCAWQLTVQYLHQTVRDFIKSPKAQGFLQSSSNPNFDPSMQLCVSYLMQLKAWMGWASDTTRAKSIGTVSSAIDNVTDCLRQAANVRKENETAVVSLLKELKGLMGGEYGRKLLEEDSRLRGRSAISKPTPSSGQCYFHDAFLGFRNTTNLYNTTNTAELTENVWTRIIYDSPEVADNAFLSLACFHGVVPYVEDVAREGGSGFRPRHLRNDLSLLLGCLCNNFPNPKMVECLLDIGEDPNSRSSDANVPTPWTVAIIKVSLLPIMKEYFPTEDYLSAERKWKEILKLMFVRGGNKAKVPEHLMSPIASKIMKEIKDELKPDKWSLASLGTWFGMTN